MQQQREPQAPLARTAPDTSPSSMPLYRMPLYKRIVQVKPPTNMDERLWGRIRDPQWQVRKGGLTQDGQSLFQYRISRHEAYEDIRVTVEQSLEIAAIRADLASAKKTADWVSEMTGTKGGNGPAGAATSAAEAAAAAARPDRANGVTGTSDAATRAAGAATGPGRASEARGPSGVATGAAIAATRPGSANGTGGNNSGQAQADQEPETRVHPEFLVSQEMWDAIKRRDGIP